VALSGGGVIQLAGERREPLVIRVMGTPQPQGSARAFVNKKTGRAIITSDNRKTLHPWRQMVAWRAKDVWGDVAAAVGPIQLQARFFFARPSGHYRKDGQRLRLAAPADMCVKPDLDKLVRAVKDSLKDAGVYRNDSQVTGIDAEKEYAEPGTAPGVQIVVLFP
jgi:Holliday junction resolvase RusA-like endonuclease